MIQGLFSRAGYVSRRWTICPRESTAVVPALSASPPEQRVEHTAGASAPRSPIASVGSGDGALFVPVCFAAALCLFHPLQLPCELEKSLVQGIGCRV
jgi:hypothetical protein